MNSFICWIGGKKLLRNKILEEFPDQGSFNRYIEVFGGAGWVLFSSDRHAKMEVLFYLDPPYYETEKYYPDRFIPEDHVRLKDALKRLQGKFLLSYNDCEYIREIYRGYEIVEVNRMHNLVQGEKKPRFKEVLIKNY